MRRLLHIARIVLKWLGVTAAVIVVVVVFLLTTNLGLRVALGIALPLYNAAIPGEVAFAAVEGRLLGAFTVRGLRLSDESGAALVTADAIAVAWAPARLLTGELEIEALVVERLQVRLPGEGGGFADLAPPGEDVPVDMSLPPGPNLPLGIDVTLQLRDAALFAADGRPLVEALELNARARGAGRAAMLELTVDGGLLPGGRAIQEVALQARWAAPLAVIDALRVVVDAAVLEVPGARLDVRALRGALELRASAAIGGLVGLVPAATIEALKAAGGRAELAVSIEGDPKDMSAVVQVGLAPGLTLLASAAGGWAGTPRADVTLAAEVDLRPWTGGQLGRVRPVVELHGRGLRGGEFGVVGGVRCEACDRLGGLTVDVEGVVDAQREGLTLATAIDVAGAAALVDVRAVGGELRQLDWRLAVIDLARTAAVAGQFAAVPQLEGTVTGRGLCVGPELRCAGALELWRLATEGAAVAHARVDVDGFLDHHFKDGQEDMSGGTVAVGLRGLRGGGGVVERGELRLAVATLPPGPVRPPVPEGLPRLRADLQAAIRGPSAAQIDMSVETGDALVAELRALEVAHGGLGVALDGPARAMLSGTRLEVEDLGLRAAGGRVAAAGVVDAEGPSDLRVEVEGVSLAKLGRLVPGLRPSGRMSAQLRAQGRPEAPELQADLAITRAGLGGQRFGDLALAVGLKGGRGEVDLTVRGPLARRLSLQAEGPLRVDMSKGTWSMGQEYTRVELRAEDVRMRRLGPLLGAEADGQVDGFVLIEAHGTDTSLPTPRILGEWRGRGLRFKGAPIGEVALSFSHRGEWLQAQVEAHRSGGRAQLDVQVPLALDVMRGRYTWHRGRDHRGLLVVEGVDVARQLEEVAPELEVGGRVSLRAELSGPATAPEVTAELQAEALRHRRLAIGSFSLAAVMRDGGLSLELGGGGGQVGRLQARALAPIAFGSSGLRWRRGGWYALDVDLHELVVGPLGLLAGVDVGGRVTGTLSLAGTGTRPRLHAAVRTDRLLFKGARVGALQVEAGYSDGAASVMGRGRLGIGTEVLLDARVPVDVDLEAMAAKWPKGRPATVRLDVTKLDDTALRPFAALPEATRMAFDIHAQAELDADQVRGHVEATGQLGHKLMPGMPVAIRLDVDDAKQRLRGRLGEANGEGALSFAVEAEAPLPAVRRGETSLLAAPIRGDLKAEATDLRYLSGLLPEALYDLTGAFSSELALRGSLGRPELRGSARLESGGITVVPLQQRFRDLNLAVAVEGTKVRLTRLTATSGEGQVKASGAASLAAGGELTAELDVALRRLPVVRPGLPQMTVDTKVRADVRSSAEALEVDIAVADTEIRVSELTTRAPTPTPENENVTILARSGRPAAAASEAEDAVLKDMSLKVRLKSPVHIQGAAMDMRWSGALALRRRGGAAAVTGGFESDRGRFELLGTRFQIERGRVFLPPDGATIDPYIDLTADASTPQAEVQVSLRGRLSRPELRLSSRPALTEGQIFAVLLTGTADTQETDPKRTQASAAGLLLNFSNPTLTRFADKRFGIDRIKLGFADDVTQPVLTIGKHLTKTIYTETTYRHNAPARQNRIEGQIEYRFKPAWSLETFFGDAAVGGLDVFWRRRFGRTGVKAAAPKPK